jgi:hypothetical protein
MASKASKGIGLLLLPKHQDRIELAASRTLFGCHTGGDVAFVGVFFWCGT